MSTQNEVRPMMQAPRVAADLLRAYGVDIRDCNSIRLEFGGPLQAHVLVRNADGEPVSVEWREFPYPPEESA